MAVWKRRDLKKKYKDYRKYKPFLRKDFSYACVYCTIHEGEFGGFHSFHVEHFRPKSKFPGLETQYTNLLYACWKCNSFKGEDWPSGNPLKSGKGYLDPCVYDYAKYFTVDNHGIVTSTTKAARYMIERLHFNCNFLIKIRNERKRIRELIEKYKFVVLEIDALLAHRLPTSVVQSLKSIRSATLSLLTNRRQEWYLRFSPPYEPEDLR